jgi:hypothetical protein
MREVLDDVDFQYRKLMTYSPELISAHAINAEGYQKLGTGINLFLRMVLISGGSNLSIASAIGFVKACLDIVETHESLLLGAKAILAARLALNTLPKVFAGYSTLTIGFKYVLSIPERSIFRVTKQSSETY